MHGLVKAILLVASVTASQHDHPQASRHYMLRQLRFRHLHRPRSLSRASLIRRGPGSLLPGRNPFINKALTGMHEEVQELGKKQMAAEAAQGKLRGTVNKAKAHMNDVVEIKRAIAQKEAQLRNQKSKKSTLEENMNQIEQMHAKLVESLHKSMDPKVHLARARLKKRQEDLQNEQDATTFWEDQEQKVKTETSEAIKDEKAGYQRLVELQRQTGWAKQQRNIAEKRFEYARQMAKEEIQSLKYAQGQYHSEVARLKAAGEAAGEVEQTLGAEDNLRAMEQVEDARRTVHEEEDEAQSWKDNVEHINTQAAELIKQNKTSHDVLLEMQAQVEWTKQEQGVAEKQYRLKKAMAAQEVANLKYVETKYEAEVSKLKAVVVAVKAADKSVQKLDAIRTTEEQKVRHHAAIGKGKLQSKMREWEIAHDQTARDIASLERQYGNWKQNQQQLSQQVEDTAQAKAAAFEAYGAREQEAFNKAQTQVYEPEISESKIAWDGKWADED